MKDIVAKNKAAFAILLIAIFLRVFRFPEFVTFLGDQGRDAVIARRIISLEHFPAIGPTSSVGGVFLGPFFYYLISPFLLLFNFDPVGLAVSSLVFSVAGVILCYFIIKKEINLGSALVYLVFVTFSAVHIDFARTSWNPHLLPITSFLTLYFWHRSTKQEGFMYPVLAGVFASISFQLHYLSLILLAFMCIVWLNDIIVTKKRLPLLFKTGVMIASFLIVISPLILFDLKHDFLNARNFIETLSDKEFVSSSSPLYRILETNAALYRHIFKTEFNLYLALGMSLFLLFLTVRTKDFSKKTFVRLNLFFWIFFILSFGYLNSFRHPHYFTPVYFSFFVVVGYALISLKVASIIRIGLLFFVLGAFIILNAKEYYFFKNRGSNQIEIARRIARSLLDHNPEVPYQIVPEPFTETDGHIRYFLELAGKRPIPEESIEEPTELYILCYRKEGCNELAAPQWQIASFKNAKLDSTWSVEPITIYKVVHGR